MARYHSPEEIRRYDLMKLGVLLLLLALLFLTWLATRDADTVEVSGEPAGTATVESLGREEATLPVPTLGVPAINLPAASPQPGSVTLSGTAGPGAQVVVLVNGTRAGAAITGVDGNWSTAVDLPAGEYTVQAQTVDNVGAIVGESQPVVIIVGGAPPTGTAAINPPTFDPVSGTYIFTGSAAPGDTVIIISNGMVVGMAVADETGAYSVSVIADAVAGDIQLQVTDAAGNILQQSEPLKLGARPPSLDPSTELQFDPSNGAVVLPARPEGLTLSGQGEPGTQVELVIDGTGTATAVVDAEGNWSLPVDLAEGTYTFQLNTLDPGGELLSGSTPVVIVVGTVPEGGEGSTTGTPGPTVETVGDTSTQPTSEVLAASPDFSTLVSVLETTGSMATLAEPGPFTVFAPTNEAFALLPQRVIDGLNANPTVLTAVLQYHITRGRYLAADLRIVQPATVNDRLLTITPQGDTLLVNDALVTTPDIITANGVVHAIDHILVPPLAEGVRPPVIDSSGVATFTGSFLTIVGTAEPNRTILVELNGEPFGQPATVGPDTNWSVSGDVTPGEYQIVAYMLGAADALEAISRPVTLIVNPE